jgi:hypothetical protein
MRIMQTNKKALCAAIAISLMSTTAARAASDYVQCDGQSKGMGVAEGLARFTLILGTLGMIGSPESDNVAERRFGAEGVAACDRAMDDGRGKADDRRRSRLKLARAIHNIEAKDYDAALSDVRAFPAFGGAMAQDSNFQRSLGLSALDLEAHVLLRKGDADGAEKAALRMAAASPYDMTSHLRASRFMQRTTPMTGEKADYYRRFTLIWPEARIFMLNTLRWQNDYTTAAREGDALMQMYDKPGALIHAQTGLDMLLAGRAADSQKLFDTARAKNDDAAAGTPDANGRDWISRTDDLLSFAGIVKSMQAGDLAAARRAFGSRERWLSVPVATVAAIGAKLRIGASAAELTGALSRDPEALKADAIRKEIDGITSAEPKTLYSAIRPFLTDGSYNGLARNVNETAKSKFMPVKQDTFRGERVTITGGYGVASSEALYLHSALVAKSRGLTGFAIMPGGFGGGTARVLFEKPGSSAIPASAFFEADKVIADLGPRFAPPAPAR